MYGTTNGVRTVIERLCLRHVIMQADPADRDAIDAEHPDVVARVAAAERELSIFSDKDGAFTRPAVLINAKQMEPAKWWKMYGAHLPILSGIAATVLAQVVSASAAERNWSIYGEIKSEKRLGLSHAKADKLVYIHETLHLKEKLQMAGYKAKLAQWDSDSDSDDEDDDDKDPDLV